MDEKEVLHHVLTLIDYQENKEDFITKFLSVLYLQTIEEMLQNLDPLKREQFTDMIAGSSEPAVLQEAVTTYLPKKEFDEKLKTVTQSQFTEYLETIYPTLSPEKQQALTTYLSTLPQPQ